MNRTDKTPAQTSAAAPPQAEVSDRHGLSLVWILPLLALLIGCIMVWQHWRNQGPTVTIDFTSAAGLEVQKTKVKIRELDVGYVSDIRLHDGASGVRVEVQLDRGVADLLAADSRFWVVSPRITRSGISGLNTLLSGVYIELSPGDSKRRAHHFNGLDEPPVTPSGTPGMHVTLTSIAELKYAVGDPVLYRGLDVGQVEEVSFDVERRSMRYRAFIQAPYHQLIHAGTRFWSASGVAMSLDADGFRIRAENLQSLLTNALTFGDGSLSERQEDVPLPQQFFIYSSEEAAASPTYQHALEYVILVSDSVRGLSVGAPVEYRGLNIGEVREINYRGEMRGQLSASDYDIPVLIALFPGRMGWPDSGASLAAARRETRAWIGSGLQASLKTGNLLTGQMFIDLQHQPQASEVALASYADLPVIPGTPGNFSQIAQGTEELIDTLNRLPLEQLAGSADELLADLSNTANNLDGLGSDLRRLVEEVHGEELVRQLNQTLQTLTGLAEDYSRGSPSYGELVSTMQTLNQRLLDMRPLLRQLNARPNSLIFAGERGQEREPRARPSQSQENSP